MFSDTRRAKRQLMVLSGMSARSARAFVTVTAVTVVLLLSACGGGGDGGSASVNIGVSVAGQTKRDLVVQHGGSTNLAVLAGDRVILNAGEPVFWTLFVGGAAVSPGVKVFYAGTSLVFTTLNASTVALDTFSDFPLAGPVAVTLVATSTFDSAQIATVNILITD